jgi:hypothetical protein
MLKGSAGIIIKIVKADNWPNSMGAPMLEDRFCPEIPTTNGSTKARISIGTWTILYLLKGSALFQ